MELRPGEDEAELPAPERAFDHLEGAFYRGTRAVASVAFSNMGVFKCTPEKVESHNEKIRRVKFEMYLENMVAKFSG